MFSVPAGACFGRFPVWDEMRVSGGLKLVHGFSIRSGGCSEGPYASLNVAFHVGDDPRRVVWNRRRLFSSLQQPLEFAVFAEQVHGTEVAVVGEGHRGAGAFEKETAVPGVDALISCTPDVLLVVQCADCFPVFLWDIDRGAVAVVHAGWRGTAGGVIEATVRKLREAAGSDPRRLRAAVGPGIGPCCYEVGPEVREHFRRAGLEDAVRGNFLDLPGALQLQLEQAGVPREQVIHAGLCTACRADWFFSHRRQKGKAGRMAAVIGLVSEAATTGR